MFKCQLSLALTHAAFVLGAVYFKYEVNQEDRLHRINPVVFAFIREIFAGSILCVLAYLMTKTIPKRSDTSKMIQLGFLLYLNQLFYILGVELAGVVMATCIQPVTPVFTVALAISLGKEQVSVYKTIGIILASAGAICMVTGGDSSEEQPGTAQSSERRLGNFILFLNTIAASLYYLYAKPLTKIYPPMSVAAWTYIIAAGIMGLTGLVYNHFFKLDWHLPSEAVGPLIYWIIICSVCGYTAIAWAMKHLPATQVATFPCLQPPIGTFLGFVILGEALTVWDLGAVGVVLGLFLVNRESAGDNNKAAPKIKNGSLPEIKVYGELLADKSGCSSR